MSDDRYVSESDVITSVRARPVSRARELKRRTERVAAGLFLAEGPQSVREALDETGIVREVFITAYAADRHDDLVEAARDQDAPIYYVTGEVLDALADTVTPQGIVAVCSFIDVPLDAVIAGTSSLGVLLAQVRDPGNAGTVVRCADAAGAQSVVFSAGSVDAYNGKTVRASVGSLFHVPFTTGVDLAEAVAGYQAAGFQVLAADGSGSVDLDEAADTNLLSKPTVWLFGNEAWGLPESDANLADAVVRIPLYGRAESLNLSTAAAICLFASARAQRTAAN
jgi:RNA methyltransferase, TrmH family